MNELNEMYLRIEALCKTKGVNITQMCRDARIPRGNLTDLKHGRTAALSTKSLGKVAAYFEVPVDYLLTGKGQALPPLSKKDERDVARRLERMLGELGAADSALMFDGEPLDEETRELLRMSLQNQLELSKRLAKKKYTPKKYRNE